MKKLIMKLYFNVIFILMVGYIFLNKLKLDLSNNPSNRLALTDTIFVLVGIFIWFEALLTLESGILDH